MPILAQFMPYHKFLGPSAGSARKVLHLVMVSIPSGLRPPSKGLPSYTGPPKYELPEVEILEMEMEEQTRTRGQLELCLNDFGTFTFRNRLTGLVTASGMDVKQRIDYNLRVLSANEGYLRIWCPIIRRSYFA